MREHLGDADLDRFRAVVESLADEFDVVEVALAAIKLAHERGGSGDLDEADIPDMAPAKGGQGGQGRPGGYESGGRSYEGGRGYEGGSRSGGGQGDSRPGGRGRERTTAAAGMTRLWLGAGREAGMRPQDLVGAITGETGLSGRDIGSIDVAPRFSLVDVPEASADAVIAALSESKIRGRKVSIRRERSWS